MRKRFFLNCLLILALVIVMSTNAFAISESDVESAVSASGKEAVSGNVLVWFLCAIAFLKVSQKIDSFLSSLGLNVGHTGGSMLSETMIAMRAINTATSAVGSALGSRSRHGSAPASGKSGSGSAAAAGFFSGGLVVEDPAFSGLHANDKVLRYRQPGYQHKMLINHADPQLDCHSGVVDMDFLSVQEDSALIQLFYAEKHLHQRTFSGTVFTDQRMDLTLVDSKIYIFIRDKSIRIYLPDVLHNEDILFHIHPPAFPFSASWGNRTWTRSVPLHVILTWLR